MALSLFSAVPLRFRVWDSACTGLLLPCFPLAGTVIGGIWWGAAELLFRSGIHNMLIAALLTIGFKLAAPTPANEAGIEWEPWSPERVAELQAQGRPVFVDFTAEWCLNCKWNERVVLNTDAVREALRGVATLKADWTNRDPRITAELKRWGRVGVPAYVFFPADGGEPAVLPEMLTPSTVIEAVRAKKPGTP